MRHALLRITLFTIFLFITNISQSIAEQRTALVIGNGNYSFVPLKNPVNDATDMAEALRKAGFTVVLKSNANLQTMEEAVEDFGNRLKRGGVGLFYYAGHGVQVNGVNYLIPVGAKINKETDVKFKALDAGRILAEMENANNGLNIVILDACRDNPFGMNFRSASRGLATISHAPAGTFISYSTGAGQVARDGEGRNSPYTEALLENIAAPGLTINKVFMNVRSKVKEETGQVPWELSSLVGDFFFIPGKGGAQASKVESPAEKAQQPATAKRPQSSGAGEIQRDGRFIAYDDGTVLDTGTNLMWAAKDNGTNVNWVEARSYCENYRGGGYTDWRMPTQEELAGLYNTSKSYRSYCGRMAHLTELIRLSCTAPWASETQGSDAAIFGFDPGKRYWAPQSRDNGTRALPVRSAR